MYSQDKINITLQVYNQCGSETETIRVLGDPTRRALYIWIENQGVLKFPRKELVNINTTQHPRNLPIEVKMNALHRRFQNEMFYNRDFAGASIKEFILHCPGRCPSLT